MSYRFQNAVVRVPFTAPMTGPVHLFALDKRGERDIHDSDFYYLQASRNGNIDKLLSGDLGGLKEPVRTQFSRLSAAAQARVRNSLKKKPPVRFKRIFHDNNDSRRTWPTLCAVT